MHDNRMMMLSDLVAFDDMIKYTGVDKKHVGLLKTIRYDRRIFIPRILKIPL